MSLANPALTHNPVCEYLRSNGRNSGRRWNNRGPEIDWPNGGRNGYELERALRALGIELLHPTQIPFIRRLDRAAALRARCIEIAALASTAFHFTTSFTYNPVKSIAQLTGTPSGAQQRREMRVDLALPAPRHLER